MVKMPSKQAIEQAYRSAIPVVSGRYKTGVEGTQNWKQAAIDGQGLYVQRMQDQSVLARREKGLAKVSDADWKNNALNKGVSRIGPGMEAGAAKQAAGYEPIRVALEGVTLVPRTTDPMQNIDNRVKPIVQAAVNAANK